MRNRSYKIDMTHTVASYLRACYLDTALFADYTFVAHFLVLSAQTFVVPYRAEYFRAEKTVSLRFEGSVINSLRLFNLSETPRKDLFRTCQPKLNSLDIFRALIFGYFNWNQFLHSLLPHLKALHLVRVPEALL